MTRLATSNYGAVTDTQFAWATTDNDLFDRELDLYRLAQAVEAHDHSATRGLAVARLAAGAVPEAALGALSVSTPKIADLAVTNAKLAAGAVTRDKMTMPLVQATNDMAGGVTMRDTSNTYAVGFYIAANGLAVFGAGAAPGSAIAGALILGQTGIVSFGTAQGAGRVNVMQAVDGATAISSGLRVYNANTSFFDDIVNHSGHLCIAAQGIPAIWVDATNKYVTIGTSVLSTSRLSIVQAAGTAVEGFFSSFGGGAARVYVDASGNAVHASATTTMLLAHAAAQVLPGTDNTTVLGTAALRWSDLRAVTATFSGAVSTGAITAPSAVFSGAVQANAIVLTGGHLLPSVNGQNVLGSSGQGFQGGYIGALIVDANGLYPLTNNTKQIGSAPSNMWASISVTDGFKPGGGSWSATSDIRSKYKTKFRPYTSGLDVILQLEPTWYVYNGDYGTPKGREYAGFRAEELQLVAPDMVRVEKVKRQSEEDPEEDILMVDPSNLPLMLVNAIQDLHAEIEALKAQLEDRKN